MQGFQQNRDQPIQIEAATLEMRDKKKEATFSGNVKVIQGDTTMTSKTLVVYYESSGQRDAGGRRSRWQRAAGQCQGRSTAAAGKRSADPGGNPGSGGASSIKKLIANGNVIVTQKDQVVTRRDRHIRHQDQSGHHDRRGAATGWS